VRNAAKGHELAQLPTVDVVMGDMLRTETLGLAVDGVDSALMISSAGPEMLDPQCRFIDAAKQARCGTSSNGPARNPESASTRCAFGSRACTN
jgi:uncharacterized protein YbjT (DUF2867 family)